MTGQIDDIRFGGDIDHAKYTLGNATDYYESRP
jgi:hypothetical protein